MPEKSLYLSELDQRAPRTYVRKLLIFPFTEATTEDAISALGSGLHMTFEQLPYLAGHLGPVDTQTGRLPLTYPKEITNVQDSGVFSYTMISDPKYDYERLKSLGMPLSMFRGEVVCPHILRGNDGIEPRIAEGHQKLHGTSTPVTGVQACFIPGGLILSVYIHHSVLDGAGMDSFLKLYAENVRSLRYSPAPVAGAEDITISRSIFHTRIPALDPNADLSTTSGMFSDGIFNYERTLPANTPCSGKMFVIPAARIRAFRDTLGKSSSLTTPPTICQVISALLWIHVTRARAVHLRNYQETYLSVVVDARRRLDPPLDANYGGNAAIHSKGSMPITSLTAETRVSEATIISVIKRIQAIVAQVGNDWLGQHLARFANMPTIPESELALRFHLGPDIYVTSWMHFDINHEWDIPGTAVRTPEYVRTTYAGNADGGMLIMPRRNSRDNGIEAPYEVLVRLAEVDMERLEKEEGGLASWAERIVE
ncbi:hypothetical protein P154DRAFT_449360 [Amniculicola lignicola CBS 123094]|uniref:Trichothecene 3-O-acetyltransferas-like protein n=1 Tax=Amniculicola lignicola CBS 123094 TaxID=1392246 RepID=A0A6A5W3P3_9PLEO|nr:hypothetical protein P154DRAFT_449360 [Amniculicola lignicola CBS 123094]